MDRRTIVMGIAGGLLAIPFIGEAQQTKVYRVGVLHAGPPRTPGSAPSPGGFLMTLRDLGFIEGQNLIIEDRAAEDKMERFPTLAVELLALKPDVIVAFSTPAALAAMRATQTIPIVMVNVSDPVASGLVRSLARPTGNITGMSDFGIEVAVKQVDLLRTLVPGTTRFAVLMSDNPADSLALAEIEKAAKKVGLTALPTKVISSGDLAEAFASMANQRAGAVIWLGGAPISIKELIDLAAKARLPVVYQERFSVEEGGLIGYGPNPRSMGRAAAIYVARILKGAKPADLPVQQPTELELVINLKTASALGLRIPQSLLSRADEIIR